MSDAVPASSPGRWLDGLEVLGYAASGRTFDVSGQTSAGSVWADLAAVTAHLDLHDAVHVGHSAGGGEEVVVKNVIGPYLSDEDLYVTTSILKTKPPAGGRPAHTGGVSSWNEILKEIRLLLGDSSATMLTTLIDYYGFPPRCSGDG